MSKGSYSRVAVVFSLIFLLLTACGAEPLAPATAPASDETRVRASVQQAVDAFRAGDVDTLVRLHTDDAVILKPGEEPEIGKPAMRASLESLFEQFTVEESRTIEELEIIGDWAFTWGKYSIKLTPNNGSAPINESGKYIDILRKQPDGSWLFARTMWNTTSPEGT